MPKNHKRYNNMNRVEIEKTPPNKRLTGVGFYMIVGLAILKDLLDIPADYLLFFQL